MVNQSKTSEQSLAGFVSEIARRVPRSMPLRIDGEMYKPLPSLLYRIYEAPYTLEHRTLIRILKAIVKNVSKHELRREEIDALSSDVLHLLNALINDYVEGRYTKDEITAGISWIESQFRDLGT